MIIEESIHFRSYECKAHYYKAMNLVSEGEFQEKEAGHNGNIFVYIYLIYNRSENVYYCGQTRYMPFFRWQEHVKIKRLGDIKDLVFSVLTEVGRIPGASDENNQSYLNSLESMCK